MSATVDLLALTASLGASVALIGLGLALRRPRRPRTWSAVPGGSRRDFFGDAVAPPFGTEELEVPAAAEQRHAA